MPFENVKKVILFFTIDILISAVMVFLSIRSYILSTGYYAYQDQAWIPYATVTIGQHPGGLFSPLVGINSLDVFALFRDFYTFPYYIISEVVSNYLLLQKIFILYSFLLFALILFLGGHLFSKYYVKRRGIRLGFLKQELIATVFVLIAYSNFSIIGLNVDGGTFSESVIFGLFLIAIMILYDDQRFLVKTLTLGGIFSLSLFLDASYVPLFILFLFIASLASLAKNRDAYKISAVVMAILISLPVIYYTVIAIHLSSNTFVPITRPFNYGYVLSRATNLNIFMVFMQMGRAWPIVAFGPPTILNYGTNITRVPTVGNLPQLLLPVGFITVLWLIATLSITVIGFFSLLYRKAWKLSIPVSVATLIFIALTQAMFLKQFDGIIQLFVSLPLVGPEIGEIFATPSHLVLLVSFGVVVLYSNLFASIVSEEKLVTVFDRKGKSRNKRSITAIGNFRKKRGYIAAVSFLLIFLVVFAYWQSFDGSYYPDGPLREGLPGGNEIPNASPFYVHNLSSTQLNVINNFLSMDKNANFGFYWPLIQTGGPQGLASSYTVSYIISHGMLGALSPFLKFQGVKYFVAWNLNNTFPFNNEGGLNSSYGVSNFTKLLNILNDTPGLTLESKTGGYFIYSVSNFNSSYESNLLIYEESFNYSIIPSFSVLSQAKIYPVYLLDSGQQNVLQENYQKTFEILNPGQIARSTELSRVENASWSPYGNVTFGTFNITTSSVTNVVEYMGNGSINGVNVISKLPATYATKENYVNVSGNLSVSAIVQLLEPNALNTTAKVVDYPYVSNTVLTTENGTYSVTATLQGSMAFLNASGNIVKISSYSVTFINYGYFVCISYSLSMLVTAFCMRHRYIAKTHKKEEGIR